MTIVAEHFDTVVGVDTHAATHTLAVVTASTGAELARAAFPTSPAGLTRAVAWIQRHGSLRRLVVIEGAGSYGVGLLGRVSAAGMASAEPSAMPARRGVGKNDDLDAVRIARSVLAVDVERLRRHRRSKGRGSPPGCWWSPANRWRPSEPRSTGYIPGLSDPKGFG